MAPVNNPGPDVTPSQEYKALQSFITESESLAATQDKFCEAVEDQYKSSDDVEEPLWTAWKCVVEMAKSIGDNTTKRTKLVEFVLQLQQRPALEKDGAVCKVWDATVWSDLPVFGAQMRESWNSANDNDSHDAKHSWLNLNAFTASLVAAAHGKPDFSLYGIWALREGLEHDKPSTIAIECAAAWLVCACPTIHELCKSGKSFDGKLAQPGASIQSKQWNGYNEERWQAWKRQLSVVQSADLGDRCQDLVGKALQKIADVEQ